MALRGGARRADGGPVIRSGVTAHLGARDGQYTRAGVERTLWPWLKDRGYADDRDDAALEQFLERQLGRRPAYLRPGLRLKGRWSDAGGADAARRGLVGAIRRDVNAILD